MVYFGWKSLLVKMLELELYVYVSPKWVHKEEALINICPFGKRW